MLIGYSFWGFLGSGIRETPDGGRSHRRTLIDGLRASGHEVVFVQANRDLNEAGHDLTDTYQWDHGLPTIDALLLEWRWPIPGRNTTVCGTTGHTCDLHRQRHLLAHYTAAGTPTLLWDKDRQLPAGHRLRAMDNVTVCEAALHPTPGAVRLLFPVDDHTLDTADPDALARLPRTLPLVYIGNQYDRDEAFDQYFAPAARTNEHAVAGKWTRTERWPHVSYLGRLAFEHVDGLYRHALTTVLLLPDRYRHTGQMTQRLAEAVLAGCLPLTPTTIRDADRFTPPALHVTDGDHTARVITELRGIAGSDRHADLLRDCLDRLDLFRLSRQLQVVNGVLARTSYQCPA
ncbi:hypothetical protein [Micromonospora sp. NPDC085948]|uniref:hypothetical protein n=1 Tax=Micromonospora sp. NPDC085948 TaxID=3155293 RepID=UPI003439FD80